MAGSGKHRLTVAQVRNAKTPGMLADGGELFLQVSKGTQQTDGAPAPPRRSWIVRYRFGGKRREMGLGSVEAVSLAEARQRAETARELAARGIDPIAQRKAQRASAAVEAARAMTFKQAAESYISEQEPAWKSEKHAALWRSTLEDYAYPTIGALPVASVDVSLVLQVLKPIWPSKNETASRVRGRIEKVLDWAAVHGYRSADNPARWQGHLQMVLPARSKVAPVKHRPALPFKELPAFMVELRAMSGLGAQALELTILCVTRSVETLGAQWAEIDLDAAVWTIPAARMKSNREHRIPLSRQAVELLQRLKALHSRGPRARSYVFPGLGNSGSLSSMAMLATLKRMQRTDITTHGFRSTFRDWCGDQTSFPRELAEQALAHVIPDATEAAYRRSDALERRRALMDAWANYCDGRGAQGGRVVPMRKRGER